MSRIALDSISGGRRASVGSQLQQLRSGGKITGDSDENLDLFSRTRRSDGDPIRLEKIAVGSTRIGRGMEDLLDAEIGKHDYDWLLTPPETPLYPSVVPRESPLSSTAPSARESPVSSTASRGRPAARSISNTRPSRLSASQTDNGHSIRPVRSSSVTRPSISSSYSSSSFSNNNNRTSVLNTSSASVTSSRPSTPGNRSTAGRPSSTTRPSSTSTNTRPSSSSTITRPSSTSTITRPSSVSRSVPSRGPTPTRTRPNPISGDSRTTRPVNSSRPSTPTSSRPQTPSNPNINSRVSSRPSTPTRRPTSSGAGSRIPSVGRINSTTTRNPVGPASRPSSPGPRPRAPVRPVDLPDFPVDAPPNLRTKLPERPASAGRTRPGLSLTARANSNSAAAVTAPVAAPGGANRRNYMPVVSKGRFPENPSRSTAKLHGNNGHEAGAAPEIQRLNSLDGGLRRPIKPVSATESTGFGRNISKKSLDMALRHMDIRQGMSGIRASSLFPQSIRSASTKGRPVRKSDPVVPLASDDGIADSGSYNGTMSPDCRSNFAPSENGDFTAAPSKSPDRDSVSARDSELDVHGGTRYDAFMLKEEDSKNMNWLHSVEDKSDQSPVFDHRFEPLPEPFGML
ncbi:uncharacterized protein A4U43_C08F33100 [Asparagus officinalis]|uniref:mucin-5AC-like n=1 Tax=Asparagus officinalis TaxID=4686 RepID=UPI00098E8311|nr:mucin-5AC-like [Asparagus officinalis]ONK61742.1 uncharacterized protein A4U43_C08F33100 [Asparagus officinalis]